eukprot:6205241-Pleurochrysis_carterae.AAC.1
MSVAVGTFGEDYALSRGAQPWTTEELRDEGNMVGKRNSKWLVKFAKVEENVALVRKALRLVSREQEAAEAALPDGSSRTRAIEHADSDSDAPKEGVVAKSPEDSSDDDDANSGHAHTACGPPNHEGDVAGGQGGQWQMNDEYATDQRVTHGHYGQTDPSLNGLIPHWETVSFFAFACQFLPMEYMGEMAACMKTAGREKHAKRVLVYANWASSLDDLTQWL